MAIRNPALSVIVALACSYVGLDCAAAQDTKTEKEKQPTSQSTAKYGLPADALIVEEQTLTSPKHAFRKLVLWMVKPEKTPNEYGPNDPYTCPDYSRGSYYRGATRVSLVDSKTETMINTVEVKQEGEDSFDVPYAIRKGYYYKVEANPKKGVEIKPHLLWLKDYNGDGKALEFALFNAEACMGLATMLIGYSEKQDKAIQYPVHLKEKEGEAATQESYWCDYLFSKKPTEPGHYKYEIDYSGRGGALEKYDIRYKPEEELFEGTHLSVGAD